jgi:hypothetical protein
MKKMRKIKIKTYLMVAMLAVPMMLSVFISGCLYNPKINPANFVSTIDNPYYPLIPGTTFFYNGSVDNHTQTNTLIVTHQHKTIIGVNTTVIWDRVYDENNSLIEETYDWYAQDTNGSVWYFGEDSKEYENGVVVSTKGSWEAGKHGAKPGVVMKAHPEVGESWWQEYALGVAMDTIKMLSLNESVTVPYGVCNNCIKTADWTPLEPRVLENKYYYPGVGIVLSVMVKGGVERMELVNVTTE